MRKFGLLAFFAIMMMVVAPAFAQDQTIADIVVASAGAETPEFATLLAAVSAADPAVLEALSNPEAELTVFAPTDAAFAALAEALGEEAFAGVLADTEALTGILTFHVVSGKVMSADVVGLLEASKEGMEEGAMGSVSVQSLNGQFIDIAESDMGITVNGANLNLEMVDIEASNGVIHVIDAVILPESRTIAEIVVESAGAETPEFATLLAAVSAADPAVLELLSDPEAELTVFAPTDAAFAAVGEETLGAVLADQALLTSILQYHVMVGKIYSTDVATVVEENMEAVMSDGVELPTALEGVSVVLTANEEGQLFLNESQIVVTDIDAANGVIHVIDAVLLPPQ
ncbi:MAG TPA: fasciclin domain-containing protein [Aggregatilineales bacterium]|nr:fasciclin domain-containing protein [Aggregatilineales bacterium]